MRSLSQGDLSRLTHCRHDAPHELYGWHRLSEGGSIVRTRQLGATKVELLLPDATITMAPEGHDLFSADLDVDTQPHYQLRVTYPQATKTVNDPYACAPTLGELDLHLISEGRHERLWEVLGANVRRLHTPHGHIDGVAFAVWAPHAEGVAVVGDFCFWNPNQYPMRSLGSTGVWELFIPGLEAGTEYKFAIHTRDGRRIDKADPLAKATKAPPETVSVVAPPTSYQWGDAEWMQQRSQTNSYRDPMSIYEVHVGSWKVGKGYRELADELVDYVADRGFTHVEFMPVAEHPFGGSWGYQVSGYYAPSARWGTPDDFRALVDAFHSRGIGVIVDWVPAHFPKDEWSLGRFDGTACYEHPDWRRGEQKDWGTFVFDFGRNEVRNFLVANALYWAEEFHVDGLRVDAVASMLYLDYSRNDGEWLPNEHGGRENYDAVRLLQECNATVHRHHPGFVTIAEESTAWPGVTAFTEQGGLGFTFKWNMGWMNDTLEYFKRDPLHRGHHHGEITFSLNYAFSENYVLPFSHDEVVHGKGSLWGRMPGDDRTKAAGLRALYGYMFSHPGKKLLFMGQEFGQTGEWQEAYSIDWSNLEGWGSEYHHGLSRLVRDMNLVYRSHSALHSQDHEHQGFQWIKSDDAASSVLAYVRWGTDGSAVLALVNLSGSAHHGYTVGVPRGTWELLLNTDDPVYQGSGFPVPRALHAHEHAFDQQPWTLNVDLPPLSVQWYRAV